MSCKEEFIEIFKEKITRPGADALLNYLENKSDFFTAPASARYHLACEGGLCEHSLNVYHCLVDYLQRERVQELYGLEYSEESVAVVALLHDVCKVGCYKKGFRNVKNDATGQWERVPTYTFDDPLPYGHGGVHRQRLHPPHPGGGHGHPLAHGLLRHRGPPHRGPGPAEVPPGLRPGHRRHGGQLLSGGGSVTPIRPSQKIHNVPVENRGAIW